MANVIRTKSEALDVTGGHLFKKAWHINAISELMHEPIDLKFDKFMLCTS